MYWLKAMSITILVILVVGWYGGTVHASEAQRVPGSCTILGLLSVEGDEASPDHISLKLMCLVIRDGKEELSTQEELVIRPDENGHYPLPYPETYVFIASGQPTLSFMYEGERTSASLIKTKVERLWSFVHLKPLIEEEE